MWSRVLGSNLFRVLNSLLLVLFLFTTASYAVDTLYWLGSGGPGTWDLTTNNWTLTSGGSPYTTWVNGDDANLPAYSSLANITVDSGGISVENITVNNTSGLGTSYILSGDPITLTGTTPTITSSSTGIWDGVRINSVISGSVGLQKDGLGFLDLYGANNYTGVTNLIGGYVTLFNDSALGSSAGGAADGTVVQSGAGFFCWVNRTIAGEYLTLNGFGDGTNTAIRVGGSGQRLTWNGPVTLGSDTGIVADNESSYTFGSTIDGSGVGANFTVNLGGNLTNMNYFNGTITLGSGSLIKNRGGTMQLTGSGNSWNTLTINNGNVQIGDGGATGSLPPAATYNISGDSTGNGQLVFNSSNNFSITSDIASAGVTTYSAGVATYPSGSSPGGIYLAGTNTGTVTLSGNNSSFSTPYTVDGGALVFSGANAVGNPLYIGIGGGANTGVVKLDNGAGVNVTISAPFSLAGRASTTVASPHLQNVSGNNVLTGNISLMESGNQYVIQSDAGAGNSLTIAGYVQNNSGAGSASARNFVLQGAGAGIVSGSITAGITATPADPNGGTNPAPINVIKTGAGTWTLSGVNTYNGTTLVNAGTLAIGASGSIAATPQIMINQSAIFNVSAFASFQIQSGQQLAGLGSVAGSVSDASGGVQIAPGYIDPSTSVNSPGNLTFSNDLKLNNGVGNIIKFDLAQTTSATSDLVTVTGNFNASNSTNQVDIDISLLQPTINSGTYPLIKYGTYTYFNADPNINFIRSGVRLGRQTLSLNWNSGLKEIELIISGGSAMNLTWAGGLSGNAWDINTTKNWTGSGPQYYFDGDLVTFDDTGSNSPNINLTTRLQPGSLTFLNNTKNYTLGGTGNLSGATGLTISGSGTVTLANTTANDFAGAININSGTLQIGDGVNSGAIPNSRNILDNGTLIFNRPDSFIFTGAISGTGAFVQQGSNIVTMNVSNSYSGSTSILGGTLVVTTLANGGANSNIGASANAAANLVFNGGILQYTGAGVSTDRLFTLGTSGGTIDASGTGALNFSNTGTTAFSGAGTRTLNLLGSNSSNELTGSNTIWAVIGNGSGGGTSIYKTGAGRWTLAGQNTFTGNVTVDNGILWAYNQIPGSSGGNNIPQTIRANTALGASTNTVTINSGGTLSIWDNAGGTWTTTLAGVTLNGGILMADDGHQTLNSPVNLTADSTIMTRYWDKDFMITGNVTGSANLLINTTLPGGLPVFSWNYGVVILAGSSNTWTGTTTIMTGGRSTLQIGNAGFGSLPIAAANTINLNGQLAFNTTNDITITDAAIVGSGTVVNWGSGTITLNGNNPSFTGSVWAGGGMAYPLIGLTTNPALNNGALRITNSNAVSSVASINLSGGTSLARIELANGVAIPAAATVYLNGRYTIPTMPVGLSSVSGSNSIAGTVSLTSGGNQYVIESKADTLTMNGLITNNSGDATPRYMFLQGAGTGVVNGVIGNGTGTGKLYVNKSGGGTWTLNGINTYNGDTTINGGVLALGATASISASPLINVKSGTLDVSAAGSIALGASQTLAGAGTVNGSVTDAASSTFSPGNSVGTLTINSNLTLAGSDNINYEIDGNNGDLLNVLGNLTLSGGVGTETVIAPTFVSPPTVANYTVASVPVTKTLAGTIAGVKVANQTRYTITPSVTAGAGGSINLSVSGSNASLIWAGISGTSTWDVLTSSPWTGGGASNMFYQSDNVTFTDSASVTTVTLNSTVKPMSVSISNNSSTYSISGTGKISGSTGLTKSGTGTATLATTNDYTGTTSVTGGTLIVSGSIGPNSPVSITGGTLRVSNAIALGDNSLGITAPTTIDGGTLDINGNNSISLQNEPIIIKGNGAVVNNGSGDYTRDLHYVTMDGNATLGGTSSGGTDSGRMEIGRWTTGGAPLGYLKGNNYILTKVGSNNVWLNNLGNVDLKGLVINGGELTIEWDNALVGTVLIDSSTGGYTPITINSGGQFGMWGRPDGGWGCAQAIAGTGPICYSNITLNGGGVGGCQSDTAAPQTYAGTINLTANSLIMAATPADGSRVTTTYFTGAITGTGNLTKPSSLSVRGATPVANNDGGTIYFTGSTSNTYSGTTTINGGGFLYLQKTGGAIAIPHDLNIAPASGGTTVSLQAPEQIADSGIVTFTGASGNTPWLDLNGYNETVGGIKDTTTYGVAELFYYGSNNNSIFTLNTTTDCSFNGTIRNQQPTPVTQLAGTLSLVKTGAAKQSLLGAQNSYTGSTTINGGTLEVDTLALGGANSGIGASSNAASNLVLNGGTLRYIGSTAATTDRLFTLGTGALAGALDASGSGTLGWTNTVAIAFTGTGARTLTLTGSNTGSNSIAEILGDATVGSATSLTKSGTGKWILSAVNTYTGATNISNGTLELASTGQIATASAISTSTTAAIFQVNGGTHTVGTISGTGTTNVLAGSTVTATSVSQGTLTIGAGATLTIAAIPGGPSAGLGSISPVPEPSTWAMLVLASMGLGIYWRRSR